ncbi:hypothetical protein [Paucilactobacillus kaifaensis]|uniref:hypothetical protein n=1 Tax=Paucilactobacillus kaifaensis TaxID=2559921 RepID=UPI0010F4B554|nr:hypothetical protein [Paucilactobacillus kaifaensis]
MKVKKLLKDVSYTVFSNLVSLLISTVLVLVVPKFIGVEDYGYWQLYLFYTSYVGILHFGWLDGIYLRFGGKKYADLNEKLFFSQFIEFLIFQIILGICIILVSFLSGDSNRAYILVMTACAMILINLRQFCLYILQDTGRMQEYAIATMVGRILYFVSVVILLLLQESNFKLFIIADILGRVLSLAYALYSCKKIIFRKLCDFYFTFGEIWVNLSIGIKLLLANFAGTLIIGVVRYGIQKFWSVQVFGKISLTLNISNLLMTFISAVGVVLYPTLRRTNKEKLRNVYSAIREILLNALFWGLLIYYPISIILPIWLPKYNDSLIYMSLLFPMCIYSGKFSLLISTFMKTYRFEKDLLVVNLISVLFSVILTILNVIVIKRLPVLMCSIIVILWVQSSLGEYILGKKLKLRSFHKIWAETIVVIIFMSSSWYLGTFQSMTVYMITIVIYTIFNKNSLKRGISYFH